MSATPEYPHKHPITAEEYFRMGDGIVFEPDARLELIEGEIFDKAPVEPPNAGCANQLNELFLERAGEKAMVSPKLPLIISGHSVPEPDFALLKRRADYYSTAHPTAADVFLVVEVADNTLRFDLQTKTPLYARCGIPEVWVIDVNEGVIHVFRDPGATGYGTTFVARPGERIASLALSEAWIEVAELFPD